MMGISALMILRHPGVAAGLILCTYGLEQWTQAKSMWFFQHQTITNYATAALLLLGIGVSLSKHKQPFRDLPLEYWLMLAIFTWAPISLIWGVYSDVGLGNFRANLPTFIAFGVLLPLVIRDRSDLRAMLMTFVIVGASLCTLLLATTDWSERNIVLDASLILTDDQLARGNPLAVAQLGSEVALAALLLNFRSAARFWQVMRYVIFGVGLAISVKSGSRGQAIGLVLLAVVMYPLARRFKDVKGFIGFAVSMVVMGAIAIEIFKALATGKGDVSERWSMESFVDAYSGGRVLTSLELLGHWAEGGPIRWLLGLGMGASYKYLGIYPHVVPAEVLGEFGFVGFAILLVFSYVSFRTLVALWVTVRDDPEDRGLFCALAGIYLFELIMAFKQGSFLSSGGTAALAAILARMLTFHRNEIALYTQLDAGGYTMSEEERQHEADELDDVLDADDGGDDEYASPLQPARV